MMKRLAALLLLTSCVATTEISDYEGRWHSDRLPFGPLADESTLILSEGNADVVVDGQYKGGGEYEAMENVAVFGWGIYIHGVDVLFLDATMMNDKLMLRWKPSDFYYPYTSVFERE